MKGELLMNKFVVRPDIKATKPPMPKLPPKQEVVTWGKLDLNRVKALVLALKWYENIGQIISEPDSRLSDFKKIICSELEPLALNSGTEIDYLWDLVYKQNADRINDLISSSVYPEDFEAFLVQLTIPVQVEKDKSIGSR